MAAGLSHSPPPSIGTTFHMSSSVAPGAGVSGHGAAVAIVEIRGDVGGLIAALGGAPVQPGRVGLRTLPNIDTLIVARIDEKHALLFPHAGPAVLRRLLAAFERLGVGPRPVDSDARDAWPEARSELEARLCEALAHAASPLAIDLLLDQLRRWGRAGDRTDANAVLSEDDSRVLRRLIDPPLVVAVGPPNIGKSSLLNALAGRAVAVVADEPGTTRDHVGVTIDMAGLVVRHIDAPGIGSLSGWSDAERRVQHDAQRIALDLAMSADLVLMCADGGSGFLPPLSGLPARASVLRVGLRSDLGRPREPHDLAVSVRTGGAEGEAGGGGGGGKGSLRELVRLIRDRLVPPALLMDQRAWRFWA